MDPISGNQQLTLLLLSVIELTLCKSVWWAVMCCVTWDLLLCEMMGHPSFIDELQLILMLMLDLVGYILDL